MRLLFISLSIAYISAIFLLANSSIVSNLATLNPYSLLHIPLYGILTFFLVFSFSPSIFLLIQQVNQTTRRNEINWEKYFLIPGGIAFLVAIADEVHQSYVPGRDASVTDVLLDLVGIGITLFFILLFYKNRSLQKLREFVEARTKDTPRHEAVAQ